MFDTLTLHDLYELHTQLFTEHRGYHDQTRVFSPLSDEWQILHAKCNEISETASSVFTEIQRRERETLDA